MVKGCNPELGATINPFPLKMHFFGQGVFIPSTEIKLEQKVMQGLKKGNLIRTIRIGKSAAGQGTISSGMVKSARRVPLERQLAGGGGVITSLNHLSTALSI